MVLAGIGCLCIIYYIIIVLDSGLNTSFAWVWLVLGAFFAAITVVYKVMKAKQIHLSLPIMWIGSIVLILGLIFFIVVEGVLIFHARGKASSGADYVIVLGAQVRGETPSRILRSRVEAAAKYLEDSPGTKAIVTGGQGAGEDITEALCMERMLLQMGIEHDRIIKEEAATDTFENINNSLNICGRDKKIVIVTCGYHIYRSKQLAIKAGATDVSGYAAMNDRILTVNYYFREFFALVKYKICGQI